MVLCEIDRCRDLGLLRLSGVTASSFGGGGGGVEGVAVATTSKTFEKSSLSRDGAGSGSTGGDEPAGGSGFQTWLSKVAGVGVTRREPGPELAGRGLAVDGAEVEWDVSRELARSTGRTFWIMADFAIASRGPPGSPKSTTLFRGRDSKLEGVPVGLATLSVAVAVEEASLLSSAALGGSLSEPSDSLLTDDDVELSVAAELVMVKRRRWAERDGDERTAALEPTIPNGPDGVRSTRALCSSRHGATLRS